MRPGEKIWSDIRSNPELDGYRELARLEFAEDEFQRKAKANKAYQEKLAKKQAEQAGQRSTQDLFNELNIKQPKSRPLMDNALGNAFRGVKDWGTKTNEKAIDLSAGQSFFRGTSKLIDFASMSRLFGGEGLTGTATKKYGNDWMKEALTDDVSVGMKGADLVNELGSALLPMGALYKGVNAGVKGLRAGGNALAQLGKGGNIAYRKKSLLPGVRGENLAKQSLAETGGVGALAALGYNVGENTMAGIGPGGDQRSNLERGLTTTGEAVLGGGLDVAGRLVGRAISNLRKGQMPNPIETRAILESPDVPNEIKSEVMKAKKPEPFNVLAQKPQKPVSLEFDMLGGRSQTQPKVDFRAEITNSTTKGTKQAEQGFISKQKKVIAEEVKKVKARSKQELDEIKQVLKQKEDDFVNAKIEETGYESQVAKYEEIIKKANESLGAMQDVVGKKIFIPKQNLADYPDFPKGMLTSDPTIGHDIAKAADNVGMGDNIEGFSTMLRGLVDDSKTLKKDVVTMTKKEVKDLERLAKEEFKKSNTYQSFREPFKAIKSTYDEQLAEFAKLDDAKFSEFFKQTDEFKALSDLSKPKVETRAVKQANPLASLGVKPNEAKLEKVVSPKAKSEVVVTTAPSAKTDAIFQYNKEPKAKPKVTTEKGVNVRTKLVDDLAMVQHVENKLNNVKSSVEGKAYQLQRLTRGGASSAHQDIKVKLNPILKSMKKDGVNSDELMSFALAKRADWLMKNKGYKATYFGKSNNAQTIKNTLDKFEGNPKFQKHYKEVRTYLDDLVDDMEKVGLVTKESAKYFKNSNYIPTGREKVEDGFDRAFSDLLPAEYRKVIKELDGGSETSEIGSPLEQMVMHTFNTRQAIFKNQANKELLSLARRDKDNKFMKVVAKAGDASHPDNVIKVYENGEEVLIDASKELVEAVKGATVSESNIIAKLAKSYTRIQRTSNTATPEFLVRSIVREIPFAYTTSSAKFSLTKDLPMSILDLVTNGKALGNKSLLDKYYSSGAGQNTIYAMDRDISAKTILKAMKGKDSMSKKMITVANPKSMFDVLRIFADVTEQMPKLAEYRATLRKGTKGKNWLKEAGVPEEILQRAAYNARDIMDYSRAGSSTREMNKYVAFLNSAIQGKSKVYRAFKKDAIGTATRGLTTLTLPAVGMFYMRKLLASDEQETAIRESPDWVRRSFHLVPIPGDSEERLIRIPKSFDLSPIFSTSVERGLEHMYDMSEQTTMDGIKEFMAQMADIPTELTAASLLYEIPSNYSKFLDRDIVPKAMTGQDTEKIEQDNAYVTSTARFMAGIVNGFGADESWAASPMMMDYALKNASGSLGSQVMDFVDILLGDSRNPKPKNSEPKNILSPKDTLSKAFITTTKGRSSNKTNDVYDVQSKLKRMKKKYEDKKEDFPYASVYTEVNKTQRELSEIASQIREIDNDPQYSAEQKQQARNTLSKQRNELARDFSDKFSALRDK